MIILRRRNSSPVVGEGGCQFLTYRRFDTLAYNVRLRSKSGEFHFDPREIEGLHQTGEFPLERRSIESHGIFDHTAYVPEINQATDPSRLNSTASLA
jgi:hypothetical protein